jgi:hypothetical protein
LDGGFYYNNPVCIAAQERKLIWPGMASYPPDILISIGTGYDSTRADSDAQISKIMTRRISFFTTAMNRLNSMVDCNQIWDEFLANEVGTPPDNSYLRRFRRFNPDLKSDCPNFDEIGKLKTLQKTVKDWLIGQEGRKQIKQVAKHLVASCFYFDMPKPQPAHCIRGICRPFSYCKYFLLLFSLF